MTDEKKKDNKDRKKLSDEELEDVAGGKKGHVMPQIILQPAEYGSSKGKKDDGGGGGGGGSDRR